MKSGFGYWHCRRLARVSHLGVPALYPNSSFLHTNRSTYPGRLQTTMAGGDLPVPTYNTVSTVYSGTVTDSLVYAERHLYLTGTLLQLITG